MKNVAVNYMIAEMITYTHDQKFVQIFRMKMIHFKKIVKRKYFTSNTNSIGAKLLAMSVCSDGWCFADTLSCLSCCPCPFLLSVLSLLPSLHDVVFSFDV